MIGLPRALWSSSIFHWFIPGKGLKPLEVGQIAEFLDYSKGVKMGIFAFHCLPEAMERIHFLFIFFNLSQILS